MSNQFDAKWVRRFTVDKTAKHKNGFTIYKITSFLFPIDSPETVTIVTVWKRYSEIQNMHKTIKTLHSGLHLPGSVPNFNKWSYFKRFDPEVIEDRMRAIKRLLDFVGEHNLLFTSSEFVKFLQSGHQDPFEESSEAPISSIRSELHLPTDIDALAPPITYDDSCSEDESTIYTDAASQPDKTAVDPSRIPIYEPFDCEMPPPGLDPAPKSESLDSLSTVDSGASLPYDEIMQIDVDKIMRSKHVLPDLINFDEKASTSRIEDYHTMDVSESAADVEKSRRPRSDSKVSISSKRSYGGFSIVDLDVKCKTDESYVFEAGYLLNMAARSEECCSYKKAFECYKSGIEKMLIGVQTDPDPQRKALIKQKIDKYLNHTENLYKKHSAEIDEKDAVPELNWEPFRTCSLPLNMLHRPYTELSKYRVLGIVGEKLMLVFDTEDRQRYVMKVIQKIPHNLTVFDTVFPHRTLDVKRPILPTTIPYMVQLNSYIETPNLVFLLLTYASGGKLMDYIRKYTSSMPSTPKRVNLDNVLKEPSDAMGDVLCIPTAKREVHVRKNIKTNVISEKNLNKTVEKPKDSKDMTVEEMVSNAQKLLKDINTALSGETARRDTTEARVKYDKRGIDSTVGAGSNTDREIVKELLKPATAKGLPSDLLPPSTIAKWAAEILIALENLHASGVICRDLRSSNILLGEKGQAILTYFTGYTGEDLTLSIVRRALDRDPAPLHVAPELLNGVAMLSEGSLNAYQQRACDFWSYGAVVYEIICGFPLTRFHTAPFTSHTTLELPEGLNMEIESFLTQLLTYDPCERLGSKGIDEIKKHPYFKNIDWQCVLSEYNKIE